MKLLTKIPDDLPEMMAVPEVAKRGLLGFTSITTVRKLVKLGEKQGGVGHIQIGAPGGHGLRITPHHIQAYWDRIKQKGGVPSRPAPSRSVPRKRTK